MRMQDKVVLVTGGAAGIGRATAQRFADEGAIVAICDVNEVAGREAAAALGERGSFTKVDVTDRGACRRGSTRWWPVMDGSTCS